MKAPSRAVTVFGLAVAIAFVTAAALSGREKESQAKTSQEKSSNVVIDNNSIIIPGTKMSRADQEAMNKILRKYDKALYKIETYENGELKGTKGTLTDVVTDKQLASEIAENVKKKGFAQYAVQVIGQPGASSHPTSVPTPSPPVGPSVSPTGGTGSNPQLVTPPPIRGARAEKESEELLQRLKPILEKYSQKQ
jgi:hypothetical protein